MPAAPSLAVLSEPARAAAVLHPVRRRLLAELEQPDSAAGLARRLGLPRQRLNYHLRELEKAGLVEPVEERRRGNCVERLVRATARGWVISPAALGPLAADPAAVEDRHSSAWLVALAARALREVAALRDAAAVVGRPLATLGLETEVRFASPADRAAFTGELVKRVAELVARYHTDTAPGGRRFRFIVGGWPAAAAPEEEGP